MSGHRHVDLKVVRVFCRLLCGKLANDGAQPIHFLTARGVGYRMAKPADR